MLVEFFLVNFLAPVPAVMKIFVATGAFMVAMVAAMLFSAIRYQRISPLLWFSGVMVVILGGLTIWLHDVSFIKMKPTLYYAILAALLFGGLLRGKPLLRWLFGPIFPGLSEKGWLQLSLNWALFFVALGIANEIMRRALDFDTWLTVKVWGVPIVSLIFAAANIPMLLRHGLDTEAKREVIEETPIE